MAQQLKDPALSLLWLGSLLRGALDPWPETSACQEGSQKKEKEKKIFFALTQQGGASFECLQTKRKVCPALTWPGLGGSSGAFVFLSESSSGRNDVWGVARLK